ncbi:MAG: hypothetical protein GX817_02745 [Elusimicrobia bacterium]|nr:hypothetical protein [Elusimicrobiota bacterium]
MSLDEPVFTVSVVSRLLHIPIWMLKKLDSEEIVCPCRSVGNDRLYSIEEVSEVKYYWGLMQKRKVKIAGLKVIKELRDKDK